MSIQVNCLDDWKIKENLKHADGNKTLNKQALQLIKALEESNERWKVLVQKVISKLRNQKIKMKVKIKKLNEKAIIPTYAKEGDAGMDLTAISITGDENGNLVYGTGLALEIPEGHVGLIFPRSSNSKKDLYLTNHVGVVDSGYRGEILMKYRESTKRSDGGKGSFSYAYGIGERIGQIIILPVPYIDFVEVDELSQTERGEDGFGSSGK